jgi:hypothetical protein
MSELPVKESRLPELHLPEIDRDDIARSLSDIRLPEVDLSKLERPKIVLPKAVSNFEWPKFDVSSTDIRRAVESIAVAAHLRRRPRQSRWPLAVGGLLVAGVATVAILRNEANRARLASGASAVRNRLTSMRSNESDKLEIDADETIAFDAAETAPIETPPYADPTMIEATGYPEGLGADRDNGSPALEEAGSRD